MGFNATDRDVPAMKDIDLLKARVAELEGQLRDMRILSGKTLAERNDALARLAELEPYAFRREVERTT